MKKSTISKKGKDTNKLVKVVGKELYTNMTTGEITEMQTVKLEARDFNFEKIWLFHILDSLNLIGGQKMKVLTTLLSLKNRDNLIIATQNDLVKLAKVSRPIISETIKLLIESNFLAKKQNGVYFVNPEMLFNGGKANRLNVLIEYNNIKIKETQIDTDPDTYLLEDSNPKEISEYYEDEK
jgi:hypothetical protein